MRVTKCKKNTDRRLMAVADFATNLGLHCELTITGNLLVEKPLSYRLRGLEFFDPDERDPIRTDELMRIIGERW